MNVLLGAMSVSLVGCHTGKNATKDNTPRPQMMKYGVPTEVKAMYGVPTNIQDDIEIPADTAVVDTIEAPTPEKMPKPRQEERPVVKYGVPNMRDSQ